MSIKYSHNLLAKNPKNRKTLQGLMPAGFIGKSSQPESNRWPLPYHGSALPTELWEHIKKGSTGRIRTYDRSVNSRLLYH